MTEFDKSRINWNRTPHIRVGHSRYLGPFEAWNDILQRRKSGQDFDFEFMLFDHYWQKYDWTVRPDQDWQTLMQRRCWNLRNNFDWVRLWYSGGRDSHPILECFLKNNIPIDELAVWYNPYDQQRGPEVTNVIMPLIKKIVAANPNIKVTVVDLRLEDYDHFFKDERWMEQKIGMPGGTWLFYPGQSISMYLRRPDLFPQRDLGIRDVNLFGLEKPRLVLDQGKWYFQAVDIQYSMHWGPDEIAEMFYLHPDFPELHAKQCWMLIDHLETHYANLDAEWVNRYVGGKLGAAFYDELCLALGRGQCVHPDIGLGTNKGRELSRWQRLIEWGEKTNWRALKTWKGSLNQVSREYEEIWNSDSIHQMGFLSKKIFLKDYDRSRFVPKDDGKDSSLILVDQ